MNRRDFIKTAALAAAGTVLLNRFGFATDAITSATATDGVTSASAPGSAVKNAAMQYRKLGKTGVMASALGFGTMRLPTVDGKIDEDAVEKMFKYAIDNGLNYFDTAYMYHNGESEIVTGRILKKLGVREKIYLATKYPFWGANDESNFQKVFNDQLNKLQTDYIDFYLMHSLNLNTWKNKAVPFRIMDKMLALKKEGKIRHIGFSIHDSYDAFKTIIDAHPNEWEFCQIQMNYLDENFQAGLKGVRYASEHNIGVIIMEPLRGGYLANVPPHVSDVFKAVDPKKSPVEWAFDYLWNMPEVGICLSGMGTMQHVQDNVLYASRSSVGMFTDKENAAIKGAQAAFKQNLIPCTVCNYCAPCPVGIDIPAVFTIYNELQKDKRLEKAYKAYDALTVKPDQCIQCKKCEPKCPQHIAIPDQWKKVIDACAKKA